MGFSAISADGSSLTTRASKRRPFDFVSQSPCQYWKRGCNGVSLFREEALKPLFRNSALGRPQESASLAENQNSNRLLERGLGVRDVVMFGAFFGEVGHFLFHHAGIDAVVPRRELPLGDVPDHGGAECR